MNRRSLLESACAICAWINLEFGRMRQALRRLSRRMRWLDPVDKPTYIRFGITECTWQAIQGGPCLPANQIDGLVMWPSRRPCDLDLPEALDGMLPAPQRGFSRGEFEIYLNEWDKKAIEFRFVDFSNGTYLGEWPASSSGMQYERSAGEHGWRMRQPIEFLHDDSLGYPPSPPESI
jgi:hypothetical protein